MNTISFPKMFNNNKYKFATNLSYDIKSINESLTSLMLTSPGELLGDPAYGCGLKKNLFEIKSNINMTELRNVIVNAIEKYIPQIKVNSSNIKIYSNSNNNQYKITILYFLNNSNDLIPFELII